MNSQAGLLRVSLFWGDSEDALQSRSGRGGIAHFFVTGGAREICGCTGRLGRGGVFERSRGGLQIAAAFFGNAEVVPVVVLLGT